MDIGALSNATQMQATQRTQSAGMAGLKSAQVQAQSIISMLTKATAEVAQTQAAAAATGESSAPEQSSGRPPQRGSIVNILA
jgi:hypothetical protein